jgi:hypothetical protein
LPCEPELCVLLWLCWCRLWRRVRAWFWVVALEPVLDELVVVEPVLDVLVVLSDALVGVAGAWVGAAPCAGWPPPHADAAAGASAAIAATAPVASATRDLLNVMDVLLAGCGLRGGRREGPLSARR